MAKTAGGKVTIKKYAAAPRYMVSDRISARKASGQLVRPSPPERTVPTSLLNHETSDHLLSLR